MDEKSASGSMGGGMFAKSSLCAVAVPAWLGVHRESECSCMLSGVVSGFSLAALNDERRRVGELAGDELSDSDVRLLLPECLLRLGDVGWECAVAADKACDTPLPLLLLMLRRFFFALESCHSFSPSP